MRSETGITEGHAADLRVAAMDYARRGWSVVPMTRDKRPAARRERYKTQSASVSNLARWFTPGKLREPVCGVGIVLDDVSGGLAVRDFGESSAYLRWATEHPELAVSLPTVATSRGFHATQSFHTSAP